MGPKGLTRCARCGDLRGRFSYKWTADDAPSPTTVVCRCTNIACGQCGERTVRRPTSNYLDEATGHVWHVPIFPVVRLLCRACRTARAVSD